MQVVGGPYDGAAIDRPIPREWVYLLPDNKITHLPEYGERRGGLLHRVVKARSLDPQKKAEGAVLLYVGDRYVSCSNCRGGFVPITGACGVCGVACAVAHGR